MASHLVLRTVRAFCFRTYGPACCKLSLSKVQAFCRFISSARLSPAVTDQPIKINTVQANSKSGVSIAFDDNITYNFKNIWLRDNCQCEHCVHPVTKQKLIDPSTIDSTVHPVSWNVDSKGQLHIDWSDGDVTHRSSYLPSWLHKFATAFTSTRISDEVEDIFYSYNGKPPAEFWDQRKILQASPRISYSDFMSSDATLKQGLEFILKYGIAIITDVPAVKGHITEVANRIAYVRRSGYGDTFDVTFDPDPNTHLSYTGVRFHHHTDLPYRERAPGVQLLHCIQPADPNTAGELAGGKSFFADCFFAADWLKTHHPNHFSILTTTPVLYSFLDSQKQMWYREKWPVIGLDERGRLREAHYSTFAMRAPLIEETKIIPFYEAFRVFSQKLREDASQLTFWMKKGDLVIFNNRRLVHGRTEFDHHKVKRYLEGCYMDLDEVEALYQKMNSTVEANGH